MYDCLDIYKPTFDSNKKPERTKVIKLKAYKLKIWGAQ